MRQFVRRLLFLLHRDRYAADLEEEMRLHRELRTAKIVREGAAPTDARSLASRRFGNQTLLKEISVEMWSCRWIEDLAKDVRHTFRMLAANPLFTAVAVFTLALGIGANTAIFSVANAILLRTMPVHDPRQVYYLHVEPGQPLGAGNTGNSNSSFGVHVFEQLRASSRDFANVMAYVPAGIGKVAVRASTEPGEATVVMTSGNFFSGLGVGAVCGHVLNPADEQQHAAVAVLSYAFWDRHFERNCAAVGRTVYVKGIPFTVAGVAARNFPGLEAMAVDLWLPLQNRPELNAWGSPGPVFYAEPNWWCLKLLVRLAPDVEPAAANARLDPVFQHAAYEPLGGKPRPGEPPRKLEFRPATGVGDSGDGFRKPLHILLAMVGVLLVIACANVSMLLAARNTARQKEFSVRLAIGGSRARLFRQLFAESLVLVTGGAALGWLLAVVAARALAAWAGLEVSLDPDLRVLVFTIAISIAAAVVFGFAPLISVVRAPIVMALKSSAATAFRERSSSRAARATIAAQIALCLTLLVCAGLLVRTLHNLERENLGLRTSGLMVFGLEPQVATGSGSDSIRFFEGLLARLRAAPGIQGATLMGNRLGSGWSNNTTAVVDGRTDNRRNGSMRWNNVGPSFFTTLGIPVRQGRDFNEADGEKAPKVAIINETFAKRYFENRDPLGHHVSFNSKVPYTVVGVVADSKYTSVRETPVPMAWFPYTQAGGGSMHIALRTTGAPTAFWSGVRRAVGEYAPGLPLLRPTTQQAEFDETIVRERLVARLALCFGIVAVVLVATGLYGTLAYRVRRRTSEFGVRMAMGAQRTNLLWVVLRESLAIAAAGAAAGLPLAWLASRALESLLYGLAPDDPLGFCLGVFGVALVSIAASVIPAFRAATMDPVIALRYE